MENTKELKGRFTRVDSDFISRGIRCGGWLYYPDETVEPPVVIMAHGFAAERTFRLPAFAEKFVQRGLAVFLFDYRNFGSSDGEPRNLVNPYRQIQDWKAAIAHVRTLKGINRSKIALWGSSFSGGHVIVIASSDPEIAAIVAQVPFVDGLSMLKFGWQYIFQGTIAGIRDLIRKLTFRKPYYVPVVADPGTFAIMNTPDSKPGYMAMVPQNSSWENKCPARICLMVPFYRPICFAHKVTCPALILLAEGETLLPIAKTKQTAARMKNGILVSTSAGHFDPYMGEKFEEVAQIEADFLVNHLLN